MDTEELIHRKYKGGTIVINCVVHSDLDITKRPDNCGLCLSDLRNTMSRAIRINEWLNEWKQDAETMIRVLR